MKNIKSFEEFLYEGHYTEMVNMAKRSQDPSAELRKVAINMAGDNAERFAKMSDKEIKRYISEFSKREMDEKKNRKLYASFDKTLAKLQKSHGIHINTHATCPLDKQIQFVRPILLDMGIEAAMKFIISASSIEVNAQPKVVNKFDVEYSGTIHTNIGDGEKYEFKNVHNGLGVNIN